MKFSKPCLIIFLLSLLLISGGCSSGRGKTVRKKKKGKVVNVIAADKGFFKGNFQDLDKVRRSIVKEALEWEGTPYGYGCSTKGMATDCSGMALAIYESQTGIKLPRNSAKQHEFCHPLKPKDILGGDLAFFATGSDPKRVSHVGVMLDSRYFIHASTKKGVVISDITTPYYQRTFISFGRVPGL